MGLVYADVTLINGEDLILAKRHYIGEEEVKQMNTNMLVDTGTTTFVLMKKYSRNCNFL